MKKQYIVSEKDTKKREEFYDYIISNFNLKTSYPYEKERFINSIFPFIVDLKRKDFWVCESITCCACASQCKRIINIEEFKRLLN